METIKATGRETDLKTDQLKATLYLLQTFIEEFKSDLDKTYALYRVGEKTKLLKDLEVLLDNPLQNIMTISTDIENHAKEMIDQLIKSFILSKSGVIKFAFKTKTWQNDLHYSIILSEDTIENREEIFSFYDKYDLIGLSYKYPVYLQFVPIELMARIPKAEDILPPS